MSHYLDSVTLVEFIMSSLKSNDYSIPLDDPMITLLDNSVIL